LLTNLTLCFEYGSPVTDLHRVALLDLPSDYLIPISYVPNEVAGTCWVVLNIYPLEQSLERLTNNFGDKSTNRESLLIFIEILQTVIFILNSVWTEILMQYFDCHYHEQHIPSGPYFDYMENLLRGADRGLFDFSCEPPLCPSTRQTFTTPQETSQSPPNLGTQQTPGTMLMQLIPSMSKIIKKYVNGNRLQQKVLHQRARLNV
uniref:Kit ligand n=1 Tax=Pundamilia nyererei TaxID=303518 RepID=A0A3B4FNY1_9CICH